MIVYLNLTQIPEILEKNFQSSPLAKNSYTLQQIKEKGRIVFRAIETVYQNRDLQKDEKLDKSVDITQTRETPYLSDNNKSALTINATADALTNMNDGTS